MSARKARQMIVPHMNVERLATANAAANVDLSFSSLKTRIPTRNETTTIEIAYAIGKIIVMTTALHDHSMQHTLCFPTL